MNDFFKVYTYTPWDGLRSNQLAEVKLLSIKSFLNKYPIIEKEFFNDLFMNLNNYQHYSQFETIRRIVGPNNEDYTISTWRFLWAFDSENRMYQFLVQKIEEDEYISQATLVALAPPELAKLFSNYKGKAIDRTFSLLNEPTKIKFLIFLSPKGKSIAEEAENIIKNKTKTEKLKYIQSLANQPNIKGQWFPTFELRCPSCNQLTTRVGNYNVDFNKFICPYCGYKKEKKE